MGYDLHITRKKYWHDEDGPEVFVDEWLQIVEEDPELRLAGVNGPYFAYWSGPSRHPDPWFDWSQRRGDIHTKNPDDPMIDKMVEIAKKLGAKVQGDDGEVYLGGGKQNVILPEADMPETPESRPETPCKRSLLTRLFGKPASQSASESAPGVEPAFQVGERVRNLRGATGTILTVDMKAESGRGVIYVKMDDGRVLMVFMAAPGLTRL